MSKEPEKVLTFEDVQRALRHQRRRELALDIAVRMDWRRMGMERDSWMQYVVGPNVADALDVADALIEALDKEAP